MLRVDIGEVLITIKDNEILFTPSFRNLSKFGSGEDIVEACVYLSNQQDIQMISAFKRVPVFVADYINGQIKKKVEIAIRVLECCTDSDISSLVGEWKRNKRKKGVMPHDQIILLAKVMLDYGVTGKAKIRVSMKNKVSSYAKSFNVMDYVNNARVHLSMSRDDAESLTMTEYIMLMANKFPDNDGQTQEEYDSLVEDYFARREKELKGE